MRVILTRATVINGRQYFVGQVFTMTTEKAASLINHGRAKEYKGAYPPTGKHKIDLETLTK